MEATEKTSVKGFVMKVIKRHNDNNRKGKWDGILLVYIPYVLCQRAGEHTDAIRREIISHRRIEIDISKSEMKESLHVPRKFRLNEN
jgi:hypothetical protein